mgnify:CR=1 FL=1|jgi:chromosome partitioning protein
MNQGFDAKYGNDMCGTDPLTQHLGYDGTHKIVAVANQKGGVGKTTTTINLATALSAVGRRILIVDSDSQGNASTGLGIAPADRIETTYDLLTGGRVTPMKTAIPNLEIIPATVDLSGAEIELVGAERREACLKNAMGELAIDYDLVLIDCPPALGLLTLNALVAADEVLVPLQCEFFALEGLSMLLKTIERVRDAYNPALNVSGIVLTMYDKRNRLAREVVEDVRRVMGETVFDTIIPRNVRVSEAPSFGKPVMLHSFHSAGAQAYVHLAGEMLRRDAAATAANSATTIRGAA